MSTRRSPRWHIFTLLAFHLPCVQRVLSFSTTTSTAIWSGRSQCTKLIGTRRWMAGSIAGKGSVNPTKKPNEIGSPKQSSSVKYHQSDNTCSYCSVTFDTRNALFRHLRNDPICSPKHAATRSINSDGNGRILSIAKESVALRFGYVDMIPPGENSGTTTSNTTSTMAENVGKVLQEALMESLKEVTHAWYELSENDTETLGEMEVLGSTQASLAKLRRMALKQEVGCSASGDVLFVNILSPKAIRKEPKEKQDVFWTKVGLMTRERLQNQIPQAELFDLQRIRPAKLHAEKSATQYVYQYLLPLSWLPEADAIREWWQSAPDDPQEAKSTQFHQKRKLKVRPPESLKRLKESLRSAESEIVSTEQIRADGTEHKLRLATGRFGKLAARTKRPWHNFADPALKGNASPNNEPVWRAVDKARIVDFVETTGGDSQAEEIIVVAIIEFRGDGFVREQIRRIVGSAVAMTHSWLPPDFIKVATNRDIAIETPLAPQNRVLLSEVRYHFDELQSLGRPFFEPHETRQIVQLAPSDDSDGIGWAVNSLLERNEEETKLALENESKWLEDLHQNVAPRIRTELSEQGRVAQKSTEASSSRLTYSRLYDPVLSELRRIKSSDLWPETSAARSTVIRQGTAKDCSEHINDIPFRRKNGSFTIVNPKVQQNWYTLPLANNLFPELVEAVFDLETNLAESENATRRITVDEGVTTSAGLKGRQPSSHCAVNCDAQFTPHVDSGRGAGQKMSMIVGLGDYVGGELKVEGDAFDIQYQPLVFDGWKLRHWTNPFDGERFSLVYFTPEAKD